MERVKIWVKAFSGWWAHLFGLSPKRAEAQCQLFIVVLIV
jgi:hypothetical protein